MCIIGSRFDSLRRLLMTSTIGWLSLSYAHQKFGRILRRGPVDCYRVEPMPSSMDCLDLLSVPDGLAAMLTFCELHEPKTIDRILALADEACNGRVAILGLDLVDAGLPPQWHRDLVSGRFWPLAPASGIDYVDFNRGTDVRLTWELNRCHHWVMLCQAHLISSDRRFSEQALSQMKSWIKANPAGLGVNWIMAMEVAIRLINWFWALAFLSAADSLRESDWQCFEPILSTHATCIANRLEFGRWPGNHYLANGAGLIYAGLLLSHRPEANRWLRKGLDIILGEVPRQFNADGGHCEASIGYHRLSLELCLLPLILAERAGINMPSRVRRRLIEASKFLAGYTRQDGSAPNFGDNDSGRLLRLAPQPLEDHHALLAIANAWLGEEVPAPPGIKGQVETCWLLGCPSENKPCAPQTMGHQAFPETGLYVLAGKNLRLEVRAGAPSHRGGHAHCDAMSFELTASGRLGIVDSGTYLYTAYQDEREYFRGPAAHNVTQVDGQEMGQPQGINSPWSGGHGSATDVLRWEATAEKALLVGRHTGYAQLPHGVIWERTFFLDNDRDIIFISEDFHAKGEHQYDMRLHLAPGLRAVWEPPNICFVWPDSFENNLKMTWLGETICFLQEKAWVSFAYGARQQTWVLSFSWRAAGNNRQRWALWNDSDKSTNRCEIEGLIFPTI